MDAATGLAWGINGHPNLPWGYQDVSIVEQLALVHQLGLSSYRVDVYNAEPATVAALSQMAALAKPLGISILPVIVPTASAFATAGDAYRWGHDTAAVLAAALPSLTWEIGNELDAYAIKPGATGAQPSDFDDGRFDIASSVIRGMSDGIRTDPAASRIVDITGLHFGFLQRLSASGVAWDITGEHYYVGSAATDIGGELGGVFSQLATFGKPLALTEYNQQQGSLLSQQSEATTLTGIIKAVSAEAAQFRIQSAYVYELLDQPGLAGGEADYGLATGAGALKPAGQAVQSYFKAAGQTAGHTLGLRVSEDAWQGDAQYTIAIDGATIGGVRTASASHAAGTTQDVTLEGNWGAEPHSIAVTFTNDRYDGTGATDRNLYVDQITYDGKGVAAAPAALYSNGTANFSFLKADAATALTLHLAEDAWQGDAHYSVSLDGALLVQNDAVTAANAQGASQVVNLQAMLAAGTHDLAISFLNDAYGGTAATDRNLYVKGIDVDATPNPGAAATMLSTGTTHFQFVTPAS